ncbi:unnamed protein product [Allacma fusca]|uniref:BED-type domain-containing protein n=1 Tax=Allacma fusca TaxID=39272 RepID=A0A8J2L366_9HEXA|nr:unnamed protein product [Allacma fusca]
MEKSIFEECSQNSSDEPQPKKFKSEVWNHFTIEEDGMSAKCNYCKTIYKLTKGKGSTGNMGYHLQKHHPRKLPTVPPTNESSITRCSESIY